MASRGSIISGAKHIPGGARPTPAPQGSGPNFGQMSPLSAQLDTGGSTGNGWAYTYGGFLPRPTEDFTEGAFGPFSPILPVPVDAPPPGAERAEPRREEYRVGWNLPVGQPGTEGLKLADFSTLRTLADLYSVARACIQLRKAEIRGLEWDIMPTHDAAKKMRNDHKATADFNERRVKAIKFFKHPDPDYFSWNSWLDAVLEEIFVFDALSILMRPKWSKGTGKGLLGSDLDSLALISGPTIRPLYDINGSYPRPPAPAYQQYLYGVPRTDLMSMITQRDIDEAGLKGSEMKQFRGDQLLYLPMTPRRWTPYGFPPIERALIPVMSGLQKQGYQLDFFREGSIPGLFVSPGGTNQNMTPNQIRELQDALNAIAGDPAWKHKIIVLPADSKVMPQKPAEIADQFDEIVMSQVCMAFDIQPMEIGIMPKVSTSVSPGAANQMSKASQNIHERKATKPMLTFLADIMNGVLHNVAHQDDMRFVFEGTMEEEDEETKTKRLVLQIGAGLRSIDEGREELNLQPWGLPETSDPGWATPNGWVPLVEATEARQTGWMTGNLLELPEGEPRATATLPGAAPAPGQPAQPGAAAASANGAQPRINPVMSGRPAAMASGRGNAAPSPGHSGASAAASGGKAPAKKAPVKKATAGKMRAIESELSALARHVRKGRLISSWTPRHVDNHMLARVAENVAKGMIIEDAIEVVKASRRVGLNGQIFEETPPNTPQVPMFDAAGGGARVFPPHDVDDIPVEGEGRVNRGVEVPGGVPGSTAGGEPPRWAPAEGTSSGNTFSEPRSRRDVTPEDGDDAEAPSHRGRPEHQDGGPRGSQNGTWPRGGHGTGQAGGDSPPGTVKGVVGGAPAAEVRAVMLRNFPAEAIAWVDDASWTMQLVPLHDVDFDNEDSWAAHHQPDKVRHFAAQIEAGNPPRPAIMVKTPIHHRLRIVDGHHRALAYRSLGKPVPAYVGTIEDPTDMRWSETHSSQLHQGSDPANKGEGGMVSKESVDYRPAETLEERCGTCSMFREPNSCTLVLGIIQRDDVCDEWDPITVNQETPVAAGLTVVAADTGRVLMLQRALTPGDPAAGTWEFPGGCLDLGETPLMAAEREWQEETGCTLPRGKVTGTWVSDNGVYQGFTYVVPSESSVEIFGGRDAVSNPDDPDGDSIEALAWWEPDQLMDCPAMRPELARDLDSWLGLISQR